MYFLQSTSLCPTVSSSSVQFFSVCADGWCDCVQAMELLVEKCVSSGGPNMSPGDALRRIFECISSGIILPGEFICFPWPFQHGGGGGEGGGLSEVQKDDSTPEEKG